MTAILTGMFLIVLVALVVLSIFSQDDGDGSSKPGPSRDGDDGGLDDLLDP